MKDEQLIIQCKKCLKKNVIDTSDFDDNLEIVESHEESMGRENIHSYSPIYNCEYCDNGFEINYSISEYPIGVFQTPTIEVDGGSLIDE